MILNLLAYSLIISGVGILWRIFRKEPGIAPRIDRLPHLIRKPLTCGVCFIFWISFFFLLLTEEPFSISVPLAFEAPSLLGAAADFVATWIMLGMSSAFVFYLFLFPYEGSHWASHSADAFHKG